MNRLRVGMVGCGLVMELKHMIVLSQIPSIEVIAACDTDDTRLNQVADQFRIRHRYRDIEALLANPEIDAVGICTAPGIHEDAVIAAIDAGKHVLVEKPLALDLDACDRMIARAQSSPVKVQVGFHMRWHRQIRIGREWIHGGRLGTIETLRGLWVAPVRLNRVLPSWRDDPLTGGGCLIEFGVHQYDLWRHLLGTEVAEVFAAERSERWPGQSAAVTAVMANGVPVSQTMSELTANDIEYEIYGHAGRLRLGCLRYDGIEFQPKASQPGGLAMHARRAWNSLRELPSGWSTSRIGGDYFDSYRGQWLGLAAAVRGEGPVGCTLEDGRAAVSVALAAIESSLSRRSIMVRDAPRRIEPSTRSTLMRSTGA